MFVKRKKFTKEQTTTSRLSDRWDQQVFFILQKHPQAELAITGIRESHSKRLGSAFVASEEALAELDELKLTLS